MTSERRIYEHSVDDGATWLVIPVRPNAPLIAWLADSAAGIVHDDGLGNLYRWREPHAESLVTELATQTVRLRFMERARRHRLFPGGGA